MKNKKILSLLLVVSMLCSSIVLPVSASEISIPTLPFVEQYQDNAETFRFDTPDVYAMDGTPIYYAKPYLLENGDIIYTTVIPVYDDINTYDGAMHEIPGIAWVTARLIKDKGGETAKLEVVYNCFMLALATDITVSGMKTSGDLGSRRYTGTLKGSSLVPWPQISVDYTFTGFNSYITKGTQYVTVGAMRVSGVGLAGSGPEYTIAFDISEIKVGY